LVNEKYLRRLLIELGKQIIGWGFTTSTEVDQILEKTEQSIYNLSQERTIPKLYSSAEIVDDIFEEMKLKAKIKNSGLLSSYIQLDSILQGFQKSDLIVIAGRPSMGKTAFSLNLGMNIVKQYKIPLLIFSLEMSRQQIIYRLI
jgi:replicative DNA helicase